MKLIKYLSIIVITFSVIGCQPSRSPVTVKGHINKKDIRQQKADIPELVTEVPVLPEPQKKPRLETYTVVVNDVDVKSLLFALARDAKLNVDVFPDISGKVTLNAIDQTLPQILDRISRQVNIRYDFIDDLLVIKADTPFFRTYKIDYVNISRNSKSENLIATQIDSTGSSSGEGGSAQNNNSLTAVTSESNNHFWETLASNVTSIIAPEDQQQTTEKNTINHNLLINRENGLITVKATARQHEQLQYYIDLVLNNARRQVLIEATIAEVSLSDQFQSGIDWTIVNDSGTTSLTQNTLGVNLGAAPFFSGTYTDTGTSLGDITASVRMLETFGDVKVLSTPKVMALNNQTAILKVVDNRVYFEINIQKSTNTTSSTTDQTITSEIKTVPVGIVMQVTPYINETDEVTLNVRPTISRIINYVSDPNPDLANAGVVNEIPEIQVREVESILKVNSGDIAIIGGLMQDTVDESVSSVPFLSAIPLIGQMFSYQNDEHAKTELVIFLRPKVIKRADINSDLADFKQHLPTFDEPENEESETKTKSESSATSSSESE